jgi:hypothetical protein
VSAPGSWCWGPGEFLGQFVHDYHAVQVALTLAIVPTVVLYFAFPQH